MTVLVMDLKKKYTRQMSRSKALLHKSKACLYRKNIPNVVTKTTCVYLFNQTPPGIFQG